MLPLYWFLAALLCEPYRISLLPDLEKLIETYQVLSEVKEPRRNFAKTTIATMVFVVILYILVNVAFVWRSAPAYSPPALLTMFQFSVVPKSEMMRSDLDIASIFFQDVFGSKTASRVMAGIIALSIFGNILVMTFTASRGK